MRLTSFMLGILVPIMLSSQAATTPDPLLNGGSLAGWTSFSFTKITRHTEYLAGKKAADGRLVILAIANASASGLIRTEPVKIDPSSRLALAWRLDQASNPADETTTAGDDFPVRICLLQESIFGSKTLILVHALQHQAGDFWPSPYSKPHNKIIIHAIAGTESPLEDWQDLSVPVGQIWQQHFGSLPAKPIRIGIMVDSDNTGSLTRTMIAKVELSS